MTWVSRTEASHPCSPPTAAVLGGLHRIPDAAAGDLWRCHACGALWKAHVDCGPPSIFGFSWRRAGWWTRLRNPVFKIRKELP